MDNSIIGNIVTVTVDRPLGSYHPVHKSLCYPVNYGYVKGILAPDGEEQDAYILGVDVPVEVYSGKVVAVIHRKNDVEDRRQEGGLSFGYGFHAGRNHGTGEVSRTILRNRDNIR